MPIELLIKPGSYPKDGSDIDAILSSVRKGADEMEYSPFFSLDLSGKGFWDSVETLLGGEKKAGPPENESPVAAEEAADTRYSRFSTYAFCLYPSGRLPYPTSYLYSDFSSSFFIRLCGAFVNEVVLRPFLRGALFIGLETVSPHEAFCKKIAPIENLYTRVFVLGKRGKEDWNIPNITPVYLKKGEKPLMSIIFLNEDGGYAFIGKKTADNKIHAFHTSDIYLVEKLIEKLQAHYLLQWM